MIKLQVTQGNLDFDLYNLPEKEQNYSVASEFTIPEEADALSVLQAVYSAMQLETYHPKSIINAMLNVAQCRSRDFDWDIEYNSEEEQWEVADNKKK